MNRKRINEYHKHGCHFYGKLVVFDFLEDAKRDKRWGTFGAEVSYDYLVKAKSLAKELYGNGIEILMSFPELVIRIEGDKDESN